MYLLDTDTVIYSLKGNEAIQRNLRDRINDPIKICSITLMELYYGAYKSKRVEYNLTIVRRMENSFEILSAGKESAETFGRLKALLEKSGMRLDDFDLTIASCAMSHQLTLVTNITKHFKRIPDLKLTNWSVYPAKP